MNACLVYALKKHEHSLQQYAILFQKKNMNIYTCILSDFAPSHDTIILEVRIKELRGTTIILYSYHKSYIRYFKNMKIKTENIYLLQNLVNNV